MSSVKSKSKTEENAGLDSTYLSLTEFLKDTSKTNTTKEDIDKSRQSTFDQRMKERETTRVGEEKYYELRGRWSWYIFGYICFMLLFQAFLTMAIGFKWADFLSFKNFIIVVMVENFAQIIGMGYIVAKYLFPNNSNS